MFCIHIAFPIFNTTTTRLPKDFSTRGVFEDDHLVQLDFGEKTGTVCLFVYFFFKGRGGEFVVGNASPAPFFRYLDISLTNVLLIVFRFR